MNRDSRARRKYEVSGLPVMRPGASDPTSTDFRVALYGRICEAWRALVDIRFKLLALVPTVSILAISKLFDYSYQPSFPRVAKFVIAFVGLLATGGLLIYDLRNSELHDDLISRARRIEEELHVDTGLFRGRLTPANWLIKHDRATALIYGASLAGWLTAILIIWWGHE